MVRNAFLITLQLLIPTIVCKTMITEGIQRAMKEAEPIDCLIQLGQPILAQSETTTNQVTRLMGYSQTSQARVLEKLAEFQRQGKVDYLNSYYISNTIALKALPEVVEEIGKFSEVEEISENRRFQAKVEVFKDRAGIVSQNLDWKPQTHWSIKYIEADLLDKSVYERAKNLIYANADTGVDYTHPALIQNYLGMKGSQVDHNYSWWDANKRTNLTSLNLECGVDSKIPCDDNNHGTHTMSTVIGNFGLGVSPTTRWMACKNMDNNFGSPETYLGCLQFFLAPTDLNGNNPRPELRPHVIGNSYGCPSEEGCSQTTFTYALATLRSNGIFLSVSAGNEGSLGCSSITSPPATDISSFSVAASGYLNNARANFSSLGPSLHRTSLSIDVAAPGVNITGAVRGGRYDSYMGTSMASPHVAGAALLIMAACPHLERKVDLVEKLLRETATGVPAKLQCGGDTLGKIPNHETGFGVINVRKAIDSCSLANKRTYTR